MLSALSWYVAITLLGWLVWPALFRLLPGLPDRGYTVSRTLGLLLVAFLYWFTGVTGLTQNTVGSILLAILAVGGVSAWIYTSYPSRDDSLFGWLAGQRRLLITAEILFLVAFAGWTFVRAYNPEIQNTEKPMELAFLNGVRFSEHFPPLDPWLSGYAISYYYFGYVMMAMLADLTGTVSAVAFNLGIALLFALTLLGSYGVVYNLVSLYHRSGDADPQHSGAAFTSLLGPLFVGLMGNLESVFRLLHAFNPPFFKPGFWHWLDIIELNEAPVGVLWPPDTWRGWWWFRASRVIHDRDAAGLSFGLQPIDEFPFFSFLLGDMHPHVLALPFVLAALLLALNQLAQPDREAGRWRWASFGLLALTYGGLAFLNTWDLPIYWFILVAAMSLRAVRRRGAFVAADLVHPVLTGLGILAAGIIAYLPWYFSFGSQAGGILPNAVFPTRLHQLLIMFPALILVIWLLLDQAVHQRRRANWSTGGLFAVGLLGVLIALTAAFSYVALQADTGIQQFALASAGLSGQVPPDGPSTLVPAAARIIAGYRLSHPLTPLLMTTVVMAATALVLPRQHDSGDRLTETSPAIGFTLILILTGAMLVLGPEFVYLRDVFGQRLNTIFKFYYATWILWSVAAAFAVHVFASRRSALLRGTVGIATALLVTGGLIYTVFSVPSKTGNFGQATGQPPTLNGLAYIEQYYPDDYAAIQWLQINAQPGDVVLEAIGGQYSYFARVSMATGVPTVLGWPGHERQWRGERYDALAGTREQDVQEMYATTNMQRAQELLDRYGVTYVFVGSLERNGGYASPAGLLKFDHALTVAYQNNSVTIYRADQPLSETGVEELP